MLIDVNGIQLFYEKSGLGPPVILLHGNGEDHSIFDVLAQQLAQRYTVYAIDSRGHGKSSKVKSLDYHEMMEDIAAMIRQLDIQSPILYGFSDGGILGLLLAIHYPGMLSKLILSGVNTQPDGVKAPYPLLMKIAYFFTRDPKLRLMLTQPHIPADELRKITVPTLLLAGSKDIIKDDHTKSIAQSIPGSVLRILAGEGHGSYVLHSPKLYEIIHPFLEG